MSYVKLWCTIIIKHTGDRWDVMHWTATIKSITPLKVLIAKRRYYFDIISHLSKLLTNLCRLNKKSSDQDSQLHLALIMQPNFPLADTVIKHCEVIHESLAICMIGYDFVRIIWYNTRHPGDVTWTSWCLKSPTTRVFVQQLVPADNKDKSTLCITGSLWG